MQATTASLRPGGIGSSPLVNPDAYFSFAARTSSTIGTGASFLFTTANLENLIEK
jgi:hypothetical protein